MLLKSLPFVLVALCLTACAPYINIPPEDGDWAVNNPNNKTVRSVEVAAVRYALEREPIGGPYYLQLPEHSTPETYALVVHALGSDAVVPPGIPVVEFDERGRLIETDTSGDTTVLAFSNDAAPGLGQFPTLEVRSIHIRGAEGKVDIVRPSTSGRGLSTVDLEWEGGFGWSGVALRAWRVDPDNDPYTAPNPVPPSQRPLKSQTQ